MLSGNLKEKALRACEKLRAEWAEKGFEAAVTTSTSPVNLARVLMEDGGHLEAEDIREYILRVAFGPAAAPKVGEAIRCGKPLPAIEDPGLREAIEAVQADPWSDEDWAQILHAAAPKSQGADRNPFFRYRERVVKDLVGMAKSMGY